MVVGECLVASDVFNIREHKKAATHKSYVAMLTV